MSEQELVLFLSAAGYKTWASGQIVGMVVVGIKRNCATIYADLTTPMVYLPHYPWSSTFRDLPELLTLLGDP